jgi:hypothetical protein
MSVAPGTFQGKEQGSSGKLDFPAVKQQVFYLAIVAFKRRADYFCYMRERIPQL